MKQTLASSDSLGRTENPIIAGTTSMEVYHKFLFFHLYFQDLLLIAIIFSLQRMCDVFVYSPIVSTYLVCTGSLIKKIGEGIV